MLRIEWQSRFAMEGYFAGSTDVKRKRTLPQARIAKNR
jgi:hypothetical protein